MLHIGKLDLSIISVCKGITKNPYPQEHRQMVGWFQTNGRKKKTFRRMVTTKRRMISPIVRFVFFVETGHHLRHDEVLGEAMTVVVDIKQYEAGIIIVLFQIVILTSR